MGEQIDWSKAPEWADKHGYAGALMIEVWLSDSKYTYCDGQQGGMSFDFCAGWTSREKDEITKITNRPATPSWSGEGLPPVGVACKIIGGDSKWWSYSGFESGEIVTVRHSFKNSKGYGMVVVEGCDGGCLAVTVDCVEVIRTTEQIEADEREEAIKEMMQHSSLRARDGAKQVFGELYDAGYRKP